MTNLSKLILLCSLFIMPLLGASWGLGYEQIKVLFFLLTTSLVGLCWKKAQLKWTLISKVAGLFIFILLITSLTGINPVKSLLGKDPYYQGWILYLYLFLFYVLVKESQIKIEKYAVVLSGSALIVSLLAIGDWVLFNIFNQSIPNYAGRVVSSFGQPNFYAGFLLLILPFAYLLLQNTDKNLQRLGWICSLLSLTGIMVSYSRAAIFLALILLGLALMSQLKMKLRLGLIIFGISLILIALKVSSGTHGIVWNEFAQPATTNNPDLTKVSTEKRAYIWPLAWQIAWQKPIFGYGLENISNVFSNYFSYNKRKLFEENLKIYPVFITLKDLTIDRTHNYSLDLLLFSGILGFAGWGILIYLLIRKAKNTVVLFSLLTYLIWVQFQNQSIAHLIFFWLLAGLLDQRLTD